MIAPTWDCDVWLNCHAKRWLRSRQFVQYRRAPCRRLRSMFPLSHGGKTGRRVAISDDADGCSHWEHGSLAVQHSKQASTVKETGSTAGAGSSLCNTISKSGIDFPCSCRQSSSTQCTQYELRTLFNQLTPQAWQLIILYWRNIRETGKRRAMNVGRSTERGLRRITFVS